MRNGRNALVKFAQKWETEENLEPALPVSVSSPAKSFVLAGLSSLCVLRSLDIRNDDICFRSKIQQSKTSYSLCSCLEMNKNLLFRFLFHKCLLIEVNKFQRCLRVAHTH